MISVQLEYMGNTIELPQGETLLGRSIGCRIRFNDGAISRQHLRFLVEERRIVAEDLGSRNGSILNGKPLQGSEQLSDGDELQIGYRRLRVRIIEAGDYGLEEETETRGGQWQRPGRRDDVTPPHGTPVLPSIKDLAMSQTKTILVNCPQCRTKVPIDSGVCPNCAYKWPSGRPMSITQEIQIETAGSERRRDYRHPIDMPVIYASETLTFDAVARDLSRGGMFVATELLDDLDTTCHVTLLPDGGPALHFDGVVCHVIATASGEAGRPPGIGIKFTSLGPESASWIDQFLRNLPTV